MGLHTSFVLIEGDHRKAVERLLSDFGYEFAVVPRSVASFGAATKVLHQWHVSPTVVKKAVGLVRGWTSLYDPELQIACDPEALRRLARHAHARVFSMVSDGSTGTYGFALVQGPATRAWFTTASGTSLDVGEPLREEVGLDKEHPCEEELVGVMERIAFPYSAIDDSGTWQVLTLEAAGETLHAMAAGAGVGVDGGSRGKRPWWRFW
jgi:hypothetical protein